MVAAMTAHATGPADQRIGAAIAEAIRIASWGCGIVEVHPPLFDGSESDGKKPVGAEWQKRATRSPHTIEQIVGRNGQYGVIPWPGEGVLILDVDHRDRLPTQLPAGYRVTRGAERGHAYYRLPDGFDARSLPATAPWGEIRVEGASRHVVGPFSRHGSGDTYLPHGDELTEIPVRVLEELFPRPVVIASAEYQIPASASYALPDAGYMGSRYEAIRSYTAHLYNRGLEVDEMWSLVRDRLAPRFGDQLAEPDLRSRFLRTTEALGKRLGEPHSAQRDASVIVPIGSLKDAALTEFDSRPIEWLWPAWLPRGVVTLMDGNPGVSKSTLVADLVARITTGMPWPDGSPATRGPGRVMWITTEDDPGRVLRPRIEAAGGDASLVRFVTSEVVFPGAGPAFTDLLVRRATEEGGLELVILDPLFSHIDAKVKSIADADMRQGVMNPLNRAAEAADVAILVVRHFNKDTAASAINRGAGSLGGIVGAARALWSVAVDPEDETEETKVVGVSKLNYARAKAPQRYRVVDRIPPGWLVGTVSGIEWLGESSISMTALMSETTGVADARDLLTEILKNGPVAAVAVYARMKSGGFGRDAAKGASRRLKVVKKKLGMSDGWEWSLPEGVAPDDDATPSTPSTSSKGWHDAAMSPEGEEGAGATPSSPSGDLAGAHARREGPVTHPFLSFEEVEGVEGVASGPPHAGLRSPGLAREAQQPALTVVAADETTSPMSSWCHWPTDHAFQHRDVQTASPWCEICSPKLETGPESKEPA